ncbi:DUF2771 family protein [uncultured Jatrophihabitans sp.]|uniref:DUF2771 family protein n=1 Tax=uncultured Jatrophihabitans sp. TaxID=1610747 RepID=UPI0035CB9C67
MRRRVLGLVAVLPCLLALGGCDKPVPGVTVLSGSTSTVIPPQKYCFDSGARACRVSEKIRTINARSSSTLLIDVPRAVANSHWLVTAFRRDKNGKSTPLDGFGSPDLIHGRHSTQVSVPYGTGDYFLSVAELAGGSQQGAWVARVHVIG